MNLKIFKIITIVGSIVVSCFITFSIAFFACMFTTCQIIPWMYSNSAGYSMGDVLGQGGWIEIIIFTLIFLAVLIIEWGILSFIRWMIYLIRNYKK